MKAVVRPILVSIVTLGLAACASSGGMAGAASDPANAPQPGEIIPDDAYVSRVERHARRHGIDVTWIKPPTRRIASN